MIIRVHDLAASPEYDWVEAFRLAGGQAIYDVAEYPTWRARDVRVGYVIGTATGLRAITRYVDPETVVEPEVVSVEYASWLPGFDLWRAYQQEQEVEQGEGARDIRI